MNFNAFFKFLTLFCCLFVVFSVTLQQRRTKSDQLKVVDPRTLDGHQTEDGLQTNGDRGIRHRTHVVGHRTRVGGPQVDVLNHVSVGDQIDIPVPASEATTTPPDHDPQPG